MNQRQINKEHLTTADLFIGNEHVAILSIPKRQPVRNRLPVNYRVRFFLTIENYEAERFEKSFTQDFREYAEAETAAIKWTLYQWGIVVWDNETTADRFSVIMNITPNSEYSTGDLYTMSERADQPNGCCIYGGTARPSYIQKGREGEKRVDLGALPVGTIRQIMYLIGLELKIETAVRLSNTDEVIRLSTEAREKE